MKRYLVEGPFYDRDGKRAGTSRLTVATEERAKEVAAAAPGRTWREIEVPDEEPKG